MAHNKFINPANGDTYEWHRNQETEDASGLTRAISGTANTANVGRVRQQGASEPYTRHFKGRIFHRAQYREFWRFYKLCDTQTIYFVDHEGQVFEGQITSFMPQIVRKEPAVSPDPGMSRHYFTYDLTFEVYRFISGDMADMGVTP